MLHICHQIIKEIVYSSCMCVDKRFNSNKGLLHYSLILFSLFYSIRDTHVIYCMYKIRKISVAVSLIFVQYYNFAKGAFWNFSSLCSTLFRSCGFSATTLLCVNKHCEHLWPWSWMLSVNLETVSQHSFETLTRIVLCFWIEIKVIILIKIDIL